MRKMLDFERGIQSIFHVQDGQMYVEKTQDVTAIVEANKRQLNSVSGRMGDLVHVGEIPDVVMDRWCIEDGINYYRSENRKSLMRKLHERDNAAFKVHPGKFV